MKYTWIGLMTLMLSACIGPGENSEVEMVKEGHFPKVTGINLMGEEVTLPEALEGEYQLLAVAFEREQQAQVETWLAEADGMEARYSGLHFYEIPVIEQGNAFWRAWINNGMRSGVTDEGARKQTITLYTDREKFLKLLEMTPEAIYVLLLDQHGAIQWRTKGVWTKEKQQALTRQLQAMDESGS